jgi:hypothetical protein
MEEIGEKLGDDGFEPVSAMTVSKDIRILRKRWEASAQSTIERHVLQELAKIDELEAMYREQYAASKQPKRSKVRKTGGDNPQTINRVEKRDGDTKALQGIQWCIQQRLTLLNAYPAQRQEVNVTSWQDRAIEDIRGGKLSYDALAEAFDDNLAHELFKRAGVPITS